MVSPAGHDGQQVYDRWLLLGDKRNELLALWEVQQYGRDSFGDPDYVSIYGLRPDDWYARGIRLLGRTAVECTRDDLACAIGKDIATIAGEIGGPDLLVIDPFAGSGNTLYWILHHLPGARGLGFELDPSVFELTRLNLAALKLSVDIRNSDYLSGLTNAPAYTDELIVTFIAPPWGDALGPTSGLDLRRTSPPISEIADLLFNLFGKNRLVCAIQIYETTDAVSLADVRKRFDWSTMRIYGLNAAGENHGILLGTRGCTP